MCEALGLLSVAEVAFFSPVARKRSCPYVHMYVFVCTHTCIYVLFFHTVQAHGCR